MTESEINKLQKKLSITDAATQIYVQQDGKLTLHNIAQQVDMKVGEIFNYFSNKESILTFFYTSLIIRYRMMTDEIEDFDSFTLSEKLSNFAYASFDLLDERPAFVEATFTKYIRHSFRKTEYEKRIEQLLSDFCASDSTIPASSEYVLNDTTFSLMRHKYLRLIIFWLHDTSEGKEATMELIDKSTGFIQEVLYTSVVDRGIELTKFLWSNNMVKQNLPFWETITSSFEIN